MNLIFIYSGHYSFSLSYESIKNDLSPRWTKVIILEYTHNSIVSLKISIFDDNSDRNHTDVLMGSTFVQVKAVLSRDTKVLKMDLGKRKGK